MIVEPDEFVYLLEAPPAGEGDASASVSASLATDEATKDSRILQHLPKRSRGRCNVLQFYQGIQSVSKIVMSCNESKHNGRS